MVFPAERDASKNSARLKSGRTCEKHRSKRKETGVNMLLMILYLKSYIPARIAIHHFRGICPKARAYDKLNGQVEEVMNMQVQTDHSTYTIPSGDHVVTLRNRKRMDLTSVKSIDRFDQEEFLVKTAQGILQIQGEGLKIVHLDVDKGLLTLEGEVESIRYDEETQHGKSILHKLFG